MLSKQCERCGETFYNTTNRSETTFNARRFCSHRCANSEILRKLPAKYDGRYVNARCECGAIATDFVWFIQIAGNGFPIKAFLEVCPDCKDLMLETDKYATVIEPPEPNFREYSYRTRCDYHYKASFAGKKPGGPRHE